MHSVSVSASVKRCLPLESLLSPYSQSHSHSLTLPLTLIRTNSQLAAESLKLPHIDSTYIPIKTINLIYSRYDDKIVLHTRQIALHG
jgi:hypothetical protein